LSLKAAKTTQDKYGANNRTYSHGNQCTPIFCLECDRLEGVSRLQRDSNERQKDDQRDSSNGFAGSAGVPPAGLSLFGKGSLIGINTSLMNHLSLWRWVNCLPAGRRRSRQVPGFETASLLPPLIIRKNKTEPRRERSGESGSHE